MRSFALMAALLLLGSLAPDGTALPASLEATSRTASPSALCEPTCTIPPLVFPDVPGCSCYSGSFGWPLAEVPGDVPATADAQVGAIGSCLEWRGQPYWQIQLQLDWDAWHYVYSSIYPYYDITHEDTAQAWCTEAVAFWHLEASVPSPGGYYSDVWYPSSFVRNVGQLRTWYMTQELRSYSASGGRGRWIDSAELSYSDFRPGINAPCPGAYQPLQAYEPSTGEWPGNGGCNHSAVVDSMIVFRYPNLTIAQVSVLVIQGNSGPRKMRDTSCAWVDAGAVTDTVWYVDVRRYTAAGTESLGLCSSASSTAVWKIRGWGVDLDASGNPIMDASRIRTVILGGAPEPSGMEDVRGPTVPLTGPDPDSVMAAAISAYVDSRGGPITVMSNSGQIVARSLPSPTDPWIIPQGPLGVDTAWIEVDLRANHPMPINGVAVDWKDARIPEFYEVRWGPEGEPPFVKPVTIPSIPSHAGDVHIFTTRPTSGLVRKIRLEFPAGALTQEFRITRLHLLFEYGGPDDENAVFENGQVSAVADLTSGRHGTLRSFPNPFRGTTTFTWESKLNQVARLEVYDVAGRRIRDLGVHRVVAGTNTVSWDGRDDRGVAVDPGVYVARARGGAGDIQAVVVRLE